MFVLRVLDCLVELAEVDFFDDDMDSVFKVDEDFWLDETFDVDRDLRLDESEVLVFRVPDDFEKVKETDFVVERWLSDEVVLILDEGLQEPPVWKTVLKVEISLLIWVVETERHREPW